MRWRLSPGMVIDGFELQENLGTGGMAQLWAVARLLRGPDERAQWVLRWIGTGLTFGYLSERLVRRRLRPGGLDPVEPPIVAVGWGGALILAVLTRAPQSGARP